MTKWKVYSNPVCGEWMYRVGRQKRLDEPLHSGNIEYIQDEKGKDIVFPDKETAQRAAEEKNEEHE